MKSQLKTISLLLLLSVMVGCKEECEKKIPQKVADTLCLEWSCDPDAISLLELGAIFGYPQSMCLDLIKQDRTYDSHCKGHFTDAELEYLCQLGINEFYHRCDSNSCQSQQSQQKISVF
jgi:hypothetical protein